MLEIVQTALSMQGPKRFCISHFTFRSCVTFCANIYWPRTTHNKQLAGSVQMAKRILIVEDHKDALLILVLVLRSFGYETIEARTGAEGVEKALFDNPNLIV